MPSNLKKLIRQRMAKTGERYAAALAQLRAQRPAQSEARRAAQGTVATPSTELLVARYFGREVTFAIIATRGRCVLMVAPLAAAPALEVRRMPWRLLGEGGGQ